MFSASVPSKHKALDRCTHKYHNNKNGNGYGNNKDGRIFTMGSHSFRIDFASAVQTTPESGRYRLKRKRATKANESDEGERRKRERERESNKRSVRPRNKVIKCNWKTSAKSLSFGLPWTQAVPVLLPVHPYFYPVHPYAALFYPFPLHNRSLRFFTRLPLQRI